jgi:hypothetical protein
MLDEQIGLIVKATAPELLPIWPGQQRRTRGNLLG